MVVIGRHIATRTGIGMGHFPDPYRSDDGYWRCRQCGWRLREYTTDGNRRLRHYKP